VNLGIERLRHQRDLVAIATAKHFDVAIAETCQRAHAIELRQRPARLARTPLMFSLSGSRKNSAGGSGRAGIQVNPSEGVIRARAKIDGESGSFVVDTGASYVTLTRALVLRLKLDLERAPTVLLQTANGPRPGHLITVQAIEVQGVKAARVPAVVIDDLGGGIDGLLGLSFLSRFDLKQTRGMFEIASRSR